LPRDGQRDRRQRADPAPLLPRRPAPRRARGGPRAGTERRPRRRARARTPRPPAPEAPMNGRREIVRGLPLPLAALTVEPSELSPSRSREGAGGRVRRKHAFRAPPTPALPPERGREPLGTSVSIGAPRASVLMTLALMLLAACGGATSATQVVELPPVDPAAVRELTAGARLLARGGAARERRAAEHFERALE